MDDLVELLKIYRGEHSPGTAALAADGYVENADQTWRLTEIGLQKIAPELERASVFSDPE